MIWIRPQGPAQPPYWQWPRDSWPSGRGGVALGPAHEAHAGSAMVAHAAAAALRGTAFGVFNLVSGIAMLVSSGSSAS